MATEILQSIDTQQLLPDTDMDYLDFIFSHVPSQELESIVPLMSDSFSAIADSGTSSRFASPLSDARLFASNATNNLHLMLLEIPSSILFGKF